MGWDGDGMVDCFRERCASESAFYLFSRRSMDGQSNRLVRNSENVIASPDDKELWKRKY